ncbi:unnamed protein product [Ixodes persulcatus]
MRNCGECNCQQLPGSQCQSVFSAVFFFQPIVLRNKINDYAVKTVLGDFCKLI